MRFLKLSIDFLKQFVSFWSLHQIKFVLYYFYHYTIVLAKRKSKVIKSPNLSNLT